jgi:hypothetical protein
MGVDWVAWFSGGVAGVSMAVIGSSFTCAYLVHLLSALANSALSGSKAMARIMSAVNWLLSPHKTRNRYYRGQT